ncbi:hypothetical protein FIT70_04315 [Candidatus Methylopumilus universalis]|uniref:hypothetical protein n=1 Tax=Candidatus Methylopumilus universalis TaxID=2588536 RepID=UPI00112246E7|nr:hypothetical protein [Candidatus Methylopumilus universalis]QDC99136.1 hypothetical protein FIT70_04315 [Candidatus Methylopumilus universalis]
MSINILGALKRKLNSRVVNILISISLLTLLFPGISILSFNNGHVIFSEFFNGVSLVENPKDIYPPSILRLDTLGQILLISLSLIHVSKKEFFSLGLKSFIIFLFSSVGFFYSDFFSLSLHLKGLLQLLLMIFILASIEKIYDKLNVREALNQFKFINSVAIILVFYGIYQFIIFNTGCRSPSCSYGAILFFNNPSLIGYSAIHYDDGIYRATSIFKEPSHFAFILTVIFLLNYSLVKKGVIKIQRKSQFLFFLILIFGIIIARSLYVNIFLISFILFELYNLRVKIIYKYLFSVLLLPFILISMDRLKHSLNLFVSISDHTLDASLKYRAYKIFTGLDVLANNSFGIGFNNLSVYTSMHKVNLLTDNSNVLYVLNFYILQLFVEAGYIGAISVIVIFYLLNKRFFKVNGAIIFVIFFLFYQDLPIFSPLRIFQFVLMGLFLRLFILRNALYPKL